MKKILFLAAIAVAAFTSCSKDGSGSNNDTNAIGFRAVVGKTKASLVGSKSELTNFYVQGWKATDADFSFMPGSAVVLEGSTWTYSPKKYYPTDGAAVNFYAYSPIKDVNITTDLAVASGDVTFGYTVPNAQNVANTSSDLLVASSLNNTSGSVAFTFEHALSAVTFSAKNNNTSGELTYVISKVEVSKLDNVGTYTYGTGVWTNSASAAVTYTAGLPASGVAVVPGAASSSLLSANDYMMVLPQTPAVLGTLDVNGAVDTDGTFVEVTFGVKDGSGQDIFPNTTVKKLALPTGFKFEKGKRYNFAFEFSALTAIEFTVTDVTNWSDAASSL